MSTGTTNEQKTQIQAPKEWIENPNSFYNQLNEVQQQAILGILEKLKKTGEKNEIQAETAGKLVLLNELLKNLETCNNFKIKDLNFSLSIKDIASLQNLSPETEQQIIKVIKQKVNSQKINEIQTTNLKEFLNQANLTFSENDKDFTEDEEAYKKLKAFQETRISNNEIFPEEFEKGIESTSEDLKKFLILQLSLKEQNEKDLYRKTQEVLTKPLERSFNGKYHLLKGCKYPLSESELQDLPEGLQKKLKDIQKQINNEEEKDQPDSQKLKELIQEYQYEQLPQNKEKIKNFLKNDRNPQRWQEECRENQDLLDIIANNTSEDLLQSPLFSQTFQTHEQQSAFKTFCKDLVTIDKTEIIIPTCNGNKTLQLERHLKNQYGISKENLPFKFKISSNDETLKQEIEYLQQKFTENQDKERETSQHLDINNMSCENLITVFQMWNTPKEEITKPELYGNYEDQQNEILANAPTPNDPNENPEAPETLRQKFDELRKEKANGIDFGRGAKIRIEAGSSDLPPDTDGKKYIKAEVISDNDNDFEVVVNGSELMMGDGWEGRTIKLNKTPETINRRKDFIVTKGDSSEENLAQLQKAKKAPNFTDIKREDNQYLRKGENEPVTYFSATDDANIGLPPDAEEKEAKIRKQPITYEVDYKPDGVKIKSEYFDEKGRGHSFEKDMDYDQFFLFLKNKQIQPIKKEQALSIQEDAKNASLKYQQSKPREIQWFSINALTKGISGAWKQITDAIDAKDKKNEDDFNDWIHDPDGFNLYGKLGRRGILSSVKDWAKEQATKQKIEGDKGYMDKVNEYLKIMEEDDNYKENILEADNYLIPFGDSPVLPALCGGKTPKEATIDNIVDLHTSPTEKKYKASAAVMLAQLKKRGTLYHGIPQLDGQGVWVKILLGEDARQKYLTDRQKLEQQIKQGTGDKKLLRNLLARSEVEFICNTINGDEREYFSGLENYKGLPRSYAKELDSAYQENYTTSGYSKEFEDTKHTCFSVAKEDCESRLKDGRFPAAIGQLKKMLTLIKTNKQHKDSQAMFTALLLSGKINQYCGKKEKDFIIQMARAYSFPPGLVIEDMNFERIILDCLEHISKDDPTSQNILKEIEEAMKKEPRDIASIISKTQERFSNGNREKFENFCKTELILNTRNDKPNIKTLRSELQKTDDLFTDQEVRENRDIAIHRGLNSNLGIITELKKYAKGEFSKMPDAEMLWTNVIDDVENFNKDGPGMKHLLNRFITFFYLDQDQVEQVLLLQPPREELEEYFLGTILNNYETPPELYQKVIETFTKAFTDHYNILHGIIYEKDNKKQPLTRQAFENILTSNEKQKRKIGWKYKLLGTGYKLNNNQNNNPTPNNNDNDDDNDDDNDPNNP